jgi:hypothetical protein
LWLPLLLKAARPIIGSIVVQKVGTDNGATTFGITTFDIMTFDITTLGITKKSDDRHNNAQC